jgi:predicted acylesterase/phospholipase RssA
LTNSDDLLIELPTRIGMALSGGGSRATCFHFGTLEYLERLGLLTRVTMLSTVSGGTFVGAKYVFCLTEGKFFDQFFREFYLDLRDTQVVKLALRQVGRRLPEVPSGRQNFIVSAAEVYARTFLKDSRGEPYRFGALLEMDESFPIKEVIFNATEFRTGNGFRFQRTRTGVMGNEQMRIPVEEIASLRVADIVAASSCLPGGFEPLAFPDDFAWPGGKVPEGIRKLFSTPCATGRSGRDAARAPRPVPLMDGGVYDNQGIYALLLADQRRPDPYELEMVIVSDADRKNEDIYPYPRDDRGNPLGCPRRPKGPRLGTLNLLAKGLMVVSALTALAVMAHFVRNLHPLNLWDLFLYAVPLTLAAATAYSVWWGRRELHDALSQIPQTSGAAWEDLKRLGAVRVMDGLSLRLTSLLASTTEIMPKRIRDLGYAILYSDPRYTRRRVSNLIYQLRRGESFGTLKGAQQAWDEARIPAPSEHLQAVIDYASAMDTRFWFEGEHEIPAAIVCGQATICYNLMKFLLRNLQRDSESRAFPGPAQALWERLRSDWEQLNQDPYVLFDERRKSAGLGRVSTRIPAPAHTPSAA